MRIFRGLIPALFLFLPASGAALDARNFEMALNKDFHKAVKALLQARPGLSAVTVLDKGENALCTRAWLAGKARASLDIQYFIWSDDKVGRVAHAMLLQAAERGVKCRVIVDDLLVEAPGALMLALDRHPNIDIKIYNPLVSTGVSSGRKYFNVATRFRGVNQRMHHKTFIADSLVGITGGRNMADEYFDFDHEFNFRDRDVLVAGPVLVQMKQAFEEFWAAPQCRGVSELLAKGAAAMDEADAASQRQGLLDFAANPENLAPDVRAAIDAVPTQAPKLLKEMDYCRAEFLSDAPGKNEGKQGLKGGGRATEGLAKLLLSARKEVLIQSPYAVLSEEAFEAFAGLRKAGVEVRISTNSAANSDNIQAVSGYQNQRERMLGMGIRLFEHKPHPVNMRALLRRQGASTAEGGGPIFVLHAKTLVVDREKVFIGTFNLDPRSENLNTEAGVLMASLKLAKEVADAIEDDMAPENSWDAARENGDAKAPWGRRLKLWFWRQLPLTPLL